MSHFRCPFRCLFFLNLRSSFYYDLFKVHTSLTKTDWGKMSQSEWKEMVNIKQVSCSLLGFHYSSDVTICTWFHKQFPVRGKAEQSVHGNMWRKPDVSERPFWLDGKSLGKGALIRPPGDWGYPGGGAREKSAPSSRGYPPHREALA